MDNLTALHTLYLLFTFSTNEMHANPHAFGILVLLLSGFYKFMLFDFWVKDTMGTMDNAQNART